MTDERIIEMLFNRDEAALGEIEKKYSAFCHTVAANILAIREDREECVNDVLLALWNAIPPERPESLKAYISRIVRNIAYNKTRAMGTWKRCASFLTVGDEFLETIPDTADLAEQFEASRAGEIINKFLETARTDDRRIFIMRFWLGLEYSDISRHTGFSESKIKVSVHRTRKALAELVFTDQRKLESLNSICHPFITEEILARISHFIAEGHSLILLDAPTLFESQASDFCDLIISVVARPDLRCSRIMKRDNLTETEARNRMDAQLSEEFFIGHSDYVIRNNEDCEQLYALAEEVADKIKVYYHTIEG